MLDQSIPNSARIHSALLGGKDYYPVDDVIAGRLAGHKITPAITESRRFARRAVSHLLNHHQIAQFAELGCGFPHTPNIHDIAEEHTSSARTLYIDNDQLAVLHARVLMTGHRARTAEVDLTDTVAEAVAATFDMSAPIALILSGTAELINHAPSMIATLTHALPPPTWLVLPHITADVFRPRHHLGRAGPTRSRDRLPLVNRTTAHRARSQSGAFDAPFEPLRWTLPGP
ncbi:SAM-dependent methyltransferase [Nocardia sp. NPDC003979]